MDLEDPYTYQLVVRLLASLIGGGLLFTVGLLMGWLMWKDAKKIAEESDQEYSERGRRLDPM